MSSRCSRPTVAAMLAVLALALRLVAPALHTCGASHAHGHGQPHEHRAAVVAECGHTHGHPGLEAAAAPAVDVFDAVGDGVCGDEGCAVCELFSLAPGFDIGELVAVRAPPARRASLAAAVVAVAEQLDCLGGHGRSPPPAYGSV